jgi:hypothetical protein
MTEAEWLGCAEPRQMLAHLGQTATERKLRLFGCACCRRVSESLEPLLGPFTEGRNGIEVAERYADRQADDDEMRRMHDILDEAGNMRYGSVDFVTSHERSELVLCCDAAIWDLDGVSPVSLTEENTQASLARDIFGNPFRPVALSPSWRIDTSLSLARQMYEARDFTAMPILADALQDAGCDNEDILAHCRGSSPHVRGCWVVDLVLGRE